MHFFSESRNDHGREFKEALPVNVNVSFATLRPALATAERDYVLPLTGQPLFDALAAFYADGGGVAPEVQGLWREAVRMVQFALIRLAYYDSFDQLAVQFSDTGLSDANGENRVYRYQAEALRESLHRQGYERLNDLLRFVEANIAVFPQFRASRFYSVNADSLIANTDEMQALTNIGGDMRVFARLRDFISDAEGMELPFRIGERTLAALKAELALDAGGGRFAVVLRAVRMFVALWAMAEAIPLLGLQVTHEGVKVSGERASDGKVRQGATEAELALQSNAYRTRAEQYIGLAVRTMKADSVRFPEIRDIGGSDGHEHSTGRRDNRGKKSFLA